MNSSDVINSSFEAFDIRENPKSVVKCHIQHLTYLWALNAVNLLCVFTANTHTHTCYPSSIDLILQAALCLSNLFALLLFENVAAVPSVV